jgi:catecholate siderophore receptor
MGAGVIRQSSMYAGIDNAVTVPGFTRVDAAAYLSLSRRLRAQLNVENILGARYWATSHNNNNITPGSPRIARMVWTVQ